MTKPTKEQFRIYMDRRIVERKPPPDMKQTRRELGWDLIEMERAERRHLNK